MLVGSLSLVEANEPKGQSAEANWAANIAELGVSKGSWLNQLIDHHVFNIIVPMKIIFYHLN